MEKNEEIGWLSGFVVAGTTVLMILYGIVVGGLFLFKGESVKGGIILGVGILILMVAGEALVSANKLL